MDKYKIAFIYGITDESRNTLEGALELYGENTEDSTHSAYLVDVINKKYSDFKVLKNLNYKHQPETIAYLLARVCSHIVFLNTTKDVKRHGKTGMFIMPKDISSKQWETLFLFCDMIPDYKIRICYDFVLENGLLDSKSLSSVDGDQPRNLMELFFEKRENHKLTK